MSDNTALDARAPTEAAPPGAQSRRKVSRVRNPEVATIRAANDNDNDRCADCDDPSPTWCSVNLGIFICLACSGAHRALGTSVSEVRSTTLDDLTAEQLERLRTRGNRRSNDEHRSSTPGADVATLTPDAEQPLRNAFVRAKYTRTPFEAPSEAAQVSQRAAAGATAKYDGVLVVMALGGRNLPAKDINGKSDPYLRLKLGDEQRKTKVVKSSLTPTWNEAFPFNVNEPASRTLRVECWDWDRVTSDDKMGAVEIALAEVVDADNREVDRWFKLDTHDGEVHLNLKLTMLHV